MLVVAVVGSGIPASRMSRDAGLQMLENVLATVFALGVLITVFRAVSGAHFNPVVSLVVWWTDRRVDAGMTLAAVSAYISAQLTGAAAGTVIANLMFDEPAIAWSSTDRYGSRMWIGEALATAGLLFVIVALGRCRMSSRAAVVIPAYIAAAAWFTPSSSFANPAVTLARSLTDTMTGIAPHSVPGFIAAELVGAALGLAAANALYPP